MERWPERTYAARPGAPGEQLRGDRPSPAFSIPGTQVSLELGVEREVPVFKCIVCGWETAMPGKLCHKTPDCGAMVLREHHGMARTAWLAGLAEAERRRREGPARRKKPGGDV